MATAASFSATATSTGVSTTVPNDDLARIMYYLNCVTVGVGVDILMDDLVEYKNYRTLSAARRVVVFNTAKELSPDELIDKLIFRDDEKEMTKTTRNSFWTIEAACDIVSLQRDILIAGQIRNATKVMFFQTSWLEDNYIKPMQRLARVYLGSRHCAHCKGENGTCQCTTCPRSSDSLCRPMPSLIDFLDILTEISTTPSSPAPSPRPAPAPAPVSTATISPVHQGVRCDSCSWLHIDGKRYKCSVCNDYDLCEYCYGNKQHDLTHAFMRIDNPGGKPIRLAPRAPRPPPSPRPPPPPPPQPAAPAARPVPAPPTPVPSNRHQYICDGCGARDLAGSLYNCVDCRDFGFCQTCYPTKPHDTAHRFKQTTYPGATPVMLGLRVIGQSSVPPPVPPPGPPPPYPGSAADRASTHFYKSMSATELKDYLKQRGVAYGDILDKETLCRRVWDTHCDYMTVMELNTFLSENNISIVDCRDIQSRREKAKSTFDANRPGSVGSSTSTSTSTPAPAPALPSKSGLRKNDRVKLTGLSRADMNGKYATVIQEDCGNGRAEVHIDEMEKNFKVKFDNIIANGSNSDDDYLD
ncbi:hypothetical protein M422DRAFT_38139 [Sphaerobolus stellatus SS14]|uniref:ZZ-type domain-containing protein n=1 Tax=Sphaerobolus stellatus (strain SS14) TaxID=990650 RepID=A0A0C9TBW6_SPHS4|nr:hypothetical protein M422DRAFT_38139 [Sphaerobolus stellatus SS14]